jgi:cephalosporin hydroxylase
MAVDLAAGVVTVDEEGRSTQHKLDTPEAFSLIADAWLRVGWDNKYVYGFTWMGRPVIQLPEDLLRMQELVYSVRPDVILETGVAHGGSLVFYASLCKAMGKGRVIGVDIEIRPHNRRAIEAHELFSLITLIEGDSTSPEIAGSVKSLISPADRVLLVLDSKHTKAHVLAELEVYAPLVSPGSYVVVMDGIMEAVAGAPRTAPDWGWNNPKQAAAEFAAAHPEFLLQDPALPFNEGQVNRRVTYCPDGFLLRR